MATKVWLGADGSLSNTANYTSGALPSSGDTLIFDGTSQQSVTSNLTALNNAALTGDLATVVVTSEYGGNIGSSGSPMDFGASVSLDFAGTGACYFKSASSAHLLVLCNTKAHASDKGLFLDGTETRLVVNNGHCQVMANATVPDLVLSFTDSPANDAIVVVTNGATMTDIDAAFGKLDNDAAVTNLRIGMGHVTHGTSTAATIANVFQYGGFFDWLKGTITALDGFGGELEWRNSGFQRTMTTGRFYNGYHHHGIRSQLASVTVAVGTAGLFGSQ